MEEQEYRKIASQITNHGGLKCDEITGQVRYWTSNNNNDSSLPIVRYQFDPP